LFRIRIFGLCARKFRKLGARLRAQNSRSWERGDRFDQTGCRAFSSNPLSSTIQSRIPVNCRDMRRVPANGGLFYLHAESPVFHTENDAGLGGLSPQRIFPFLAPEKCAAANFPL